MPSRVYTFFADVKRFAILIAPLLIGVGCQGSYWASQPEGFEGSEAIYGGQKVQNLKNLANLGIASVSVKLPGGAREYSTAVWINESTLVTTAHTLLSAKGPEDVEVRFTLQAYGFTPDSRILKVHDMQIHPSFKRAERLRGFISADNSYDIALLKVRPTKDIKSQTQFYSLLKRPISAMPIKELTFWSAGFGAQSHKAGQFAMGDGVARVTQISNQLKLSSWGHTLTVPQLPEGGVCTQDSGGPLFVYDAMSGDKVLVALVVSGAPLSRQEDELCRGTAHFLEIWPHIDWITQASKGRTLHQGPLTH